MKEGRGGRRTYGYGTMNFTWCFVSGPKQDLLVKRKQTDVTLPAIMARSCRAHDARMRFVCLCIHTHTHTHTHIHTHRQHNMIWPGWFVCWQRLYVCMCVCVTRAHVYVCACVCLCTCLSACRTRRIHASAAKEEDAERDRDESRQYERDISPRSISSAASDPSCAANVLPSLVDCQ